ncbi:MAG: phage tail tube protein [Candidatus Paceibacterota bacterium]|jgi:predicted secreted protein
MAANTGRRVKFYWGGNSPADEILGVREKSVSINGEPIDVTSDDDLGWRSLLTEPSQNEINISISGVVKDRRFITDWFSGNRTQPVSVVFPSGDRIDGTFFIGSLSETGPYNDAHTFEAEVMSTGIITYTAA